LFDGLQGRVGRQFLCLLALFWAGAASADMVRMPLDGNSYAVLHDGKSLFLECHVPKTDADPFLKKWLNDDSKAAVYRTMSIVAIPFAQLEPSAQRTVLLGLFRDDFVDAEGWHHTALVPERLESLCEWLTNGVSASRIRSSNKLKSSNLATGQSVLFPASSLKPAMKAPTPERRRSDEILDPEEDLIDLSDSFKALDTAANELSFGKDKEGEYAIYPLKPGEALYTAVVVRFTDFSDNKDVLAACDVVQKRSGIVDVHDMKPGQKIRIPLDMLSARYKPKGNRERTEYDAVVLEARRLKGQVRTHDLEGTVIILDPGHGGRDYGATSPDQKLLEDEINYDIVCRVKAILESQTRAKVYVTLLDPDQGYQPTARTDFSHDTDEEVLTTPPYRNGVDSETQAPISANLRWCLANCIYRRETANGVDPRKIVFTSFHCDALYNGKPRGTMVYIPGASLRSDFTCDGPSDAKFREAKEGGRYKSTSVERRREEALSRNFAEVLLDELAKKRIRRHLDGDPIRSQIRKSADKVYVPAVLKNNFVPTKVLVESANLTNREDCLRLADPKWRQSFAEGYVNALLRFYDN
jgi:N-acetylmuramoyl-L-alanine amidase